MFVAFSVGKWIQWTCNELYELIAKRTEQPTYYNKIGFCTDANRQNLNAILESFNKDCANYSQVIKEKIKQKVVGTYKRRVLGNMDFKDIRINDIDGFCSYLRARVGCFVRETRNFAKKRRQIVNVLHITQTNRNFIEAKNGETPGIKEGLVDGVLSWNDVFNMRFNQS